MLNDITLGQYFPGDTLVHHLDPRAKLINLLLYIIALFIAKTYVTYAILTLVLVITVAISKIKPSALFKGLKPLIFIIVFTALINLFYTHDGNTLIHFWKITITDKGLLQAFYMVLRIVLLIASSFLLTYTTTPMQLTDGMELLMSPLNKLKFPVHELSMMMSISLRFIPTLIEETNKIMNAQKARGADFETGKLTERAKALLPLLIPLFVSAFRRADELAIAMEARCYHGSDGRTRMKKLHMGTIDIMSIIFYNLLFAGIIILSRYGL